MKSKMILGLATLASLAIPSFAQQTYCRPDRDGDRQICTTSGYDAYGNYYQRSFSQRINNGYYGNAYEPGYYGNTYNNGYDRDAWRRREHEERERREHERHEWREHHRDRDDYR